ncbi:MAG: hypothetical protein ACOY16_00935 [Chloroflexota bacterium]
MRNQIILFVFAITQFLCLSEQKIIEINKKNLLLPTKDIFYLQREHTYGSKFMSFGKLINDGKSKQEMYHNRNGFILLGINDTGDKFSIYDETSGNIILVNNFSEYLLFNQKIEYTDPMLGFYLSIMNSGFSDDYYVISVADQEELVLKIFDLYGNLIKQYQNFVFSGLFFDSKEIVCLQVDYKPMYRFKNIGLCNLESGTYNKLADMQYGDMFFDYGNTKYFTRPPFFSPQKDVLYYYDGSNLKSVKINNGLSNLIHSGIGRLFAQAPLSNNIILVLDEDTGGGPLYVYNLSKKGRKVADKVMRYMISQKGNIVIYETQVSTSMRNLYLYDLTTGNHILLEYNAYYSNIFSSNEDDITYVKYTDNFNLGGELKVYNINSKRYNNMDTGVKTLMLIQDDSTIYYTKDFSYDEQNGTSTLYKIKLNGSGNELLQQLGDGFFDLFILPK